MVTFASKRGFRLKNGCRGRWDVDGYFPSMEYCAMELLNTLPAASNKLTGDLQSIVSAVNQAKKRFWQL